MGHHGSRGNGGRHGKSFLKQLFGGHHQDYDDRYNEAEPRRADRQTALLVVCSSCQQQNPQTAKFCQECGTLLTQQSKCGQCGVELPANSKFCVECGSKV